MQCYPYIAILFHLGILGEVHTSHSCLSINIILFLKTEFVKLKPVIFLNYAHFQPRWAELNYVA